MHFLEHFSCGGIHPSAADQSGEEESKEEESKATVKNQESPFAQGQLCRFQLLPKNEKQRSQQQRGIDANRGSHGMRDGNLRAVGIIIDCRDGNQQGDGEVNEYPDIRGIQQLVGHQVQKFGLGKEAFFPGKNDPCE